MLRTITFVLFSIFLLAFNAGCTCDAESDDELCDHRECGEATLVDRCGDSRTVDCGSCQDHQECTDHQCHCEGEPAPWLCDQHDANCGELSVTDGCNEQRTVDCGSCPSAGECVDNRCDCSEQADGKLCDVHGFDCGSAVVTDACGDSRDVDCGGCEDLYECGDNQCVCVGESDDQLCEEVPGACGSLEIADACGETRNVDCGSCASGDSMIGAVRDADSGDLLDDALVRIWRWPDDGGDHYRWLWEEDWRGDDPDFAITTGDMADEMDVNYEFAQGDPLCVDDAQTGAVESHEWYRIRVERPGYDSEVFYRHVDDFDAATCPDECPTDDDSRCLRQDFELWPHESDRTHYPDLLADPRDLQDHQWQCAQLPDGAKHDELIGLRVRLGIANVGPGPFHLEGSSGDGGDDKGVVLQHLTRSDGGTDTVTIDSDLYDYYDDPRRRFMVWAHMRLVDPGDDCLDVDGRSDDCVLHTNRKLSFCLHDYIGFDEESMALYGGVNMLFADPPICDTAEQGITPGWKDVYSRDLPGQAVILGDPSDASEVGEKWIEVDADPYRILDEKDRSTNVARLTISPPDDIDGLCEDPDTLLDCTVDPSDYDGIQRWQCPDYLEY